MAVKKNTTGKTGAAASVPKTEKKVVAKKAATASKTTKPAKSATSTSAAAKPVASGTTTKVGTPKAGAAKSASASTGAKKTAAKEATAIKLTDRQMDFLKTISAAKEKGYTTTKKAEQKTIDTLLDRKLIKRGAKDKQGGGYCYLVSKAGEKHLST